jgi:hypothetical protein
VQALRQQLACLCGDFEAQCDAFGTAHDPAVLQQQQDTLGQQEQAAEAAVATALQQLKDKRSLLLAQQAAAKELRQQVAHKQAALNDLRQQVAAESATASELMAALAAAEHEGPPAQQRAQLQAELAAREVAVLQQQCRCALLHVRVPLRACLLTSVCLTVSAACLQHCKARG